LKIVDIAYSTETLPVTELASSFMHQNKVSVALLRADLIDPDISGNKGFKLHYNLLAAREQGHDTLLSFGGPWSNHLHALAAAGHRYGFRTIGVVRGEQAGALTPCLQDAQRWGMQLHFVSRADYALKTDPRWQANLLQRFGRHYLIAEGGMNREGIRGCQQLCPSHYRHTHLLLACGTGTTMAGVITRSRVPVTGIQALKGAGYLQREIAALLQTHALTASCKWQVLDDWHGGGFARTTPALLDFMYQFESETGVLLEPVYSAKLMFAIRELITQDHFPPGASLLVIHGGGLQGRRSLPGWR
jgi:1-aminocyclopropane-1-carboxylate deaminase